MATGSNFHVNLTSGSSTVNLPLSPLDDDKYNCLSYEVLANIAHLLQTLESAGGELPHPEFHTYLNTPVAIYSTDGFRFGWAKPVDDFWVFVPDIKETR